MENAFGNQKYQMIDTDRQRMGRGVGSDISHVNFEVDFHEYKRIISKYR